MMTPLRSSLFVTFEGCEGAGKSSLAMALEIALTERGFPVTRTREPGGSPLGERIRQLLLLQEHEKISNKAELLLFLASRAQHVEELIRPSLAEGRIVLCDRFTDSTIAYQSYARGLDQATVKKLCHFAADSLIPDLTFLLDLDPEIGFKRIKKAKERCHDIDRIESEATAFHRNVRHGFLDIAAQEPQRVRILDASLPKQELLVLALVHVQATLATF